MRGRLPIPSSLRRPLALAGIVVVALTFFAGVYDDCFPPHPSPPSPGGGLHPCDGAGGYGGCSSIPGPLGGGGGPAPTPVPPGGGGNPSDYTWVENLPSPSVLPNTTYYTLFFVCEGGNPGICVPFTFTYFDAPGAAADIVDPCCMGAVIHELAWQGVVTNGDNYPKPYRPQSLERYTRCTSRSLTRAWLRRQAVTGSGPPTLSRSWAA